MASEGPNSPGTSESATGIGNIAWSNPARATASDDSKVTVNPQFTNRISRWLKATNFGFAIPAGATIDGIAVEIEKGSSLTVVDNALRIVKGGTIGSTDRADTGTSWPSDDTYVSHGSSSDLWGETWSYSDINSSGFGVALSADGTNAYGGQIRVDHIRITVYYTEGGGASIPALDQGMFTGGLATLGGGLI